MRFSDEKKRSIQFYILEKIAQKTAGVSKFVADTFGISPNTVHSYLLELQERDVIRKTKRDQYELVTQEYHYHLKRSEGQLNSDTYAYEHCLEEHVRALSAEIQQIWDYALSEMANNVMDHSAAENLYIRVQQNYLQTRVVLLDDGVGIFRKIMEYFSLPDLETAKCELFKGKLTTDSANHSGEGIFFTSKMMDTFLILSDGILFTVGKFDEEMTIHFKDAAAQGTCVQMQLSNFSNKTARGIFDRYSDVEGGFTTTRLPLKHFFDSAPVSRSQAKRICNRLEQFQEVILDFEDLEWMGQGFAHQLFVVYQNQHPTVKLRPVHMNESVAKMYHHVTHTD